MTGLEAMFVRMDRRSAYQHTLKVAILAPSGDPDGWSFDRYRRALEHQLRVVPILRQRYVETPLGLHRPVWVDDPDFDLDVHMRRIACPSPGGDGRILQSGRAGVLPSTRSPPAALAGMGR